MRCPAKISLTLALLICAGAAARGFAQDKAKDGGLTRIADGIYVDTAEPDSNAVSNAGVIVLERSALVYDTHFTPEAGQALAARIRALTPNPVRYVVLSHFHPDHTHGAQSFPATAQVISSSTARHDMLEKDIPVMNRAVTTTQGQVEKLHKELLGSKEPARQEALRKQIRSRQDFLDRMGHLKIVQPLVTADDVLTISEGARKVELRFVGAGHTHGDLVMYLPQEKVVFCGDLFFNKALPSTQDSSLLEWIRTVSELLKLDADTFVPGHGAVGTREDLQDFLGYLEELKKMVEAGVNRGDGVEQIIRDTRVPERFASYQFQNFFPANLQKMYVELKALQLAAPAAPAAEEAAPRTEPGKPKP